MTNEKIMKERDERLAILERKGADIKAWCAVDESVLRMRNIEDLNEWVKDAKEVVAEYGGLPYYFYCDSTPFGIMLSVFYVSAHEEEWEMDRNDLEEGYTCAYVMNCDVPEFSEFGSICYDITEGGAIVRTDI